MIQLHLDGHDFQGFGLRMVSVISITLLTQWCTGWDGGWILLCVSLCWVAFLAYKVTTFKENAYTQVIEDLEKQNQRLRKGNELLQNIVEDKLGVRVKVSEPE